MVKLVDPTLPFADVVARRRRKRASTDAATFGLWASTHDWRTVYPEPTAIAGIGASEQALSDRAVDLTQQLIGGSGGLLVDLGFQVCPIGAITSGMLPPSLLVWIAGESTTPDESRSLQAIGAPGILIGPFGATPEGWRYINDDEFEDRNRFIRRFVTEVSALLELPDTENVSNNLSNEPRRTGPDDGGETAGGSAADLHQHGRRRTRSDGRDRNSSGS